MSRRLLFVLGTAGLIALAGCSSTDDKAKDVVADSSIPDSASDQKDVSSGDVATDLLPNDLAQDTSPGDTSLDSADVPVLPFELGFENRGWSEKRGLIHLHSAYSHDGCAPDGYEDFGGADPACLAELRAAACGNSIDFLFMTDHPGEARNQTFEDLAQFHGDLGDEMLLDSQQRPFANKLACPDGSSRDHLYVFVGTEGNKNMPVGMAGPIPEAVFSTNYGDESELEPAIAAVATTHDLGGLGMSVHTEQDDISAQRIIDLDLDGMEIYNTHANLMAMLKGTMDTLYSFDYFMGPENNDPPSDLSLLIFLSPLPVSVSKVDTVAAAKHIVTFVATDIHRNVEFPQLCTAGADQGLCASIYEKAPNFAQLLATGGPVMLKDGERMDSYNRAMRWFANRVLVKDDEADSVRQSLREGRVFSAFDTLGVPSGFDFVLWTGSELKEMGDTVTFAQGMTIYVRSPSVGPALWDPTRELDFSKAVVTTKLVKIMADGASSVVAEVEGQGALLSASVDEAAVYRVEVWIKPLHLKPIMPGLTDKAMTEYPYIYASPIFVR